MLCKIFKFIKCNPKIILNCFCNQQNIFSQYLQHRPSYTRGNIKSVQTKPYYNKQQVISKMAKIHDKLIDVIDLTNYCYSIQVS